jgi:hypothetical protein
MYGWFQTVILKEIEAGGEIKASFLFEADFANYSINPRK